MTAVQVSLRDRVAAVYNKTGTVNNGEKVEILEHSKNGRFVRLRNPRGEEGWLEQRYLAPESVFRAVEKLSRDNATVPIQARAVARAELNMHVEPARDSDHLYQLKAGDKLELLRRATGLKDAKSPPAAKPATAPKSSSAKAAPAKTQINSTPPAYEDWWLVRDAQHRYGWVVARMLDVDVPIEVAQYAEGERIIADFVLNTVPDHDKQIPQYLLLLNESKDGAPQDFNQARVFTWNLRMHRYEIAYRERKLNGRLPAQVSTEDFGKDGRLPVFTLLVQDDAGQIQPRKYRMSGVMVRRVLAPGEQPDHAVRHSSRSRHH